MHKKLFSFFDVTTMSLCIMHSIPNPLAAFMAVTEQLRAVLRISHHLRLKMSNSINGLDKRTTFFKKTRVSDTVMFCLELFINIDSKLYNIVCTISTSLKTIPVLRKNITLQEENFYRILINSAYSEFAKFKSH